MPENEPVSPRFTTDLPRVGQTIMVRRISGGRVVHVWGEVSEVFPAEGYVSIEQPPGVDRYVWFPENGAAWHELSVNKTTPVSSTRTAD